MDALASDVKLYPDAYRHGRAGRLGVSEGCIQSALRRLKISREKNTRHPKAGSKSRQDFENKVKNHQGAIRQPSILTEAASRMTCPAPTVAHLLANAALANTVGAPKDEPMPLVRYWPVVMGNARFHKRQDIGQAIINAGHVLEYLPTHSPGLNPIGHKWPGPKQFVGNTIAPLKRFFKGIICNHFIVC